MHPADTFLLKLLADSPSLSRAELQSISDWWKADRQQGESLGDFLAREAVLVAGAARTIEMVRKGYLSLGDGAQLFADGGLEKVRGRSNSAVESLPPEDTIQVSLPLPDAGSASAASAPVRVAAPVLEIGRVLGKCLLTELLGQGGCGLVFRALHQGLNIPVAVKVLQRQALAGHAEVYQRLRTEARLLAQLNHPSIVRVLDFEDDPTWPYIVLEFVEGFSLAELILQSGALRLHRAVKIITQIAGGLAAARKLGIVHRDVKPANILLTKDGSAKLADLGLAMVVEGGLSAESLGLGRQRDDLAGTLAYMAPDQFSSSALVDHRADIYGLGATFYHAVTGQPPFSGGTPMEVMLKHVQESAVPPHHLVPELDPGASAVILRMMAKEPTQRHATYEELLADLWRLPAANTPAAPPAATDPLGRTRSSIWKSLLASFGVASIVEMPKRDELTPTTNGRR